MNPVLRGAVWRLGGFAAVCATGTFALVMVFAQLRFEPQRSFRADFTSVSGLESGQFVRIAGVEVGKVTDIAVNADNTATVTFTTDDSVVLTDGSRALIRYANIIGDRYLELQDGPGSGHRLAPGDTIPVQRTQPALDIDALIGGFRPLFRALDPDQVNLLSGQLVEVFQGQGTTINAFLAQTATLTSALADRDQLIGAVITNLNTVLGSLSGQADKFGDAVTSLSRLVAGLSERRTDIATAVAHTDASAQTVTALLQQIRPDLAETVTQTDRAAAIAVADHDYLDNLLATLPESYRILGRQGLYGDFFSFYLCELVLKLNGKGGEPVYVKLAGQPSGRCTPK
ncbi:MCE family protein [Mycolicibacterium sp.]|uniref:MCE family protein n=1 Tax=Mycolicibacterium sp. TaxID=2320850 RepID=UPI003D0BE17E